MNWAVARGKTGQERRAKEKEGMKKKEREREREWCAASAKAVLVTDCPLGVDGRVLLNQGQVERLGPDTGNCSGEAAWNKSPIPGQHQVREQGRTKPWRYVQMGRKREGVLARIIKIYPQERHKRERDDQTYSKTRNTYINTYINIHTLKTKHS